MTTLAQDNALLRSYLQATQRRRRNLGAGLVVVVLLAFLAAWGAEVDLHKFYANLGNFTSYIGRITWNPVPRCTVTRLNGSGVSKSGSGCCLRP
jgi:hypothetical protein